MAVGSRMAEEATLAVVVAARAVAGVLNFIFSFNVCQFMLTEPWFELILYSISIGSKSKW